MVEPRLSALNVLIAERHRTVAQSLSALISSSVGAQVSAVADSAADTIDIASKLQPDVAIIDLSLSPESRLISGLRSMCPHTRIIVLADREGPPEGLVRALAAGAVGAIFREGSIEELTKALQISSSSTPVVPAEAAGLLLGSYVDALHSKREREVATIEALAAAVEVKDLTTARHLERVTALADKVMSHVDSDLAQNDEIRYGFTLHDIGKIGVPDAILQKPGPLDGAEWEIMRRHPEMGVKIVDPVGFSSTTTDVILCHHEHWDGGGYPTGLKGDEIPLAARVFAAADAFDAMTSDRPYRRAMTRSDATDALRDSAGTIFDPDVVAVVIDLTESAESTVSIP